MKVPLASSTIATINIMADLDELEKVGKVVTPAPATEGKGPVDTKGSIWQDTALSIASYVDDPGEFTLTTQGQRMMMRQQKSRSVSYLELTKDGKTVRIEVYEVETPSIGADEWWPGVMC